MKGYGCKWTRKRLSNFTGGHKLKKQPFYYWSKFQSISVNEHHLYLKKSVKRSLACSRVVLFASVNKDNFSTLLLLILFGVYKFMYYKWVRFSGIYIHFQQIVSYIQTSLVYHYNQWIVSVCTFYFNMGMAI